MSHLSALNPLLFDIMCGQFMCVYVSVYVCFVYMHVFTKLLYLMHVGMREPQLSHLSGF